ncbi:hypothetical protein M413DRAFT_168037 [Hebeloma cylindrosporum]|uniref:Uncharacterized protein n=1 Tax=Hebeloma cylindrosporum TaxID=76867 RepID=A0A0C3C996_HEBCY|nr:hypothetical protein M413DRAFT_168037 [Hebeloma cylindrosporum h7]
MLLTTKAKHLATPQTLVWSPPRSSTSRLPARPSSKSVLRKSVRNPASHFRINKPIGPA